ncbi:MAG: sigma-70 family RNA polymerase sigma factor [Deltaproteobacteria bacterium]|nr:sigma-70 family RNA polymerase sigma factor [Deltaproteobacteria bacterium]
MELRWQLAMSCRRIAHGEARKMAHGHPDVEDLVQEGYIGLLRAAKRFDPERGIRFSSYARWWARAQMTRSLEMGGSLVRIPSSAALQIRNLQRERSQAEVIGAPCSGEDLASRIGVSRRRVDLLLSQGGAVSMEEPEAFSANTVLCSLSDESVPQTDAAHTTAVAFMWLHKAMQALLDDRERYVLFRRYGLDGDPLRSFAAIGREMRLSRERVRQIERDALNRIRGQDGPDESARPASCPQAPPGDAQRKKTQHPDAPTTRAN